MIFSGTTLVQVWLIRCHHNDWTRRGSGGQIGNKTVSGIHYMVEWLMVLAGAAGGTCVVFCLFPLQPSSPLLKNENKLLFAKMDGRSVGGFFFLGLRADSSLKLGPRDVVWCWWVRCKVCSAGFLKRSFWSYVLTTWGNTWGWRFQMVLKRIVIVINFKGSFFRFIGHVFVSVRF